MLTNAQKHELNPDIDNSKSRQPLAQIEEFSEEIKNSVSSFGDEDFKKRNRMDDIGSAVVTSQMRQDSQDSKELKLAIDEVLGVLAKHEHLSPTFIMQKRK